MYYINTGYNITTILYFLKTILKDYYPYYEYLRESTRFHFELGVLKSKNIHRITCSLKWSAHLKN